MMDVSELGEYQFQTIRFEGTHLELQLHSGRVKKQRIGRDVALVAAKELIASYKGLIEWHERLVKFLEDFDEVDIQAMLENVDALIEAKKELTELYTSHANRTWIADLATLDAAYKKWRGAESKVSESAVRAYELFVGPVPSFCMQPIPIELLTKDIRKSRWFYYLKPVLTERWGIDPGDNPMRKTLYSHLDLERFLAKNNYRSSPLPDGNFAAYNSSGEFVGRIRRKHNPYGDDLWEFRAVNVYEGDIT